MSTRKPSRQAAKRARAPAVTAAAPEQTSEQSVIAASNLSLHDLFQRQAMTMLDRADLSEEEKQQILVSMACPCCGAGAMSYTVKLKR